jgi:murein L,D-transpeptidase YafK
MRLVSPFIRLTAGLLAALLAAALVVAVLVATGKAGASTVDRPTAARAVQKGDLEAMFRAAGVAYPPGEVFLRAFKHEKELELWAGPLGRPLKKVKTYPFCASGELGPKRAKGDWQVPEGFYRIEGFNPASQFHLSMRVSYPNALDRKLGAKDPGGDIYIHGGCASVGCLAMGDDGIEELYTVAREAGNRTHISAHFFPRRLDEAGRRALESAARGDADRTALWSALAEGYAQFERSRRPPTVRIDVARARYLVEGARQRPGQPEP